MPYEEFDPIAFLKALKEGRGYDYIATTGWSASKEQLKDIVLELIWFIGDEMDDSPTTFDSVIEELRERWAIWEDEEDVE